MRRLLSLLAVVAAFVSLLATLPSEAQGKRPHRAKVKRRYVVAAVGDSLTDPQSRGGKYLQWLQRRCPKSRFDNYGVGGEMIKQMRRRFARDVLGQPPDPDDPKPKYTHVIILGGINDICSDESAGRKNRDIKADLRAMYRAARKHHIRVVAMTMPPWGGFKRYYNARRGASTRYLNRWIRSQYRRRKVDGLVDTYRLLSCGRPTHLCKRYGLNDRVHWSSAGHRVVGKALYRQVFANCR